MATRQLNTFFNNGEIKFDYTFDLGLVLGTMTVKQKIIHKNPWLRIKARAKAAWNVLYRGEIIVAKSMTNEDFEQLAEISCEASGIKIKNKKK